MRSKAQQQHLVRLSRAVDTNVGQRCCGEESTNRVECLRSDRLAVDEVGVSGFFGVTRTQPLRDLRQELGVAVEHAVHLADVASTERRLQDFGGPVVAVVARGETVVVAQVARRLLEVAHQATPLEELGEDVGGLLAGEVHAAELGDGVVAVFEEDLLVELLCATEPNGGVESDVARHVEVTNELIEEEATKALRAPRVTGEQCALHHLWKVDQGEYGQVQVRDVAAEDLLLSLSELLSDVDRHGGRD